MRVRLISPDQERIFDNVSSLYTRNPIGQLGVLESHVTFLTALEPETYLVIDNKLRFKLNDAILLVQRNDSAERDVIIAARKVEPIN